MGISFNNKYFQPKTIETQLLKNTDWSLHLSYLLSWNLCTGHTANMFSICSLYVFYSDYDDLYVLYMFSIPTMMICMFFHWFCMIYVMMHLFSKQIPVLANKYILSYLILSYMSLSECFLVDDMQWWSPWWNHVSFCTKNFCIENVCMKTSV